ncbi:MAG TPA: hypothetical protein VMR76_00945 [Candidatus Saccharimonadia bacterium]|nr:hypothetical protein [Candidatus Saccharimonadia bacterium]
MVQIIQENRKPTFGQSFAQGLGESLKEGLKYYEEHQKRKKTGQALQNIEGAYSNPEFSEQQRLIKAYQQLSGAGHPELAQQLGGQLSKLGGQQESFKNKIMGQNQEQNRLAQSLQNLQGVYNDPNISEEEKVFEVYQQLSQNPTLANHLLSDLQKPNKARGEGAAGEQYSKGYNAILEGDNDSLKNILEDPKTPLTVKKQLTDLKSKHETRKSVESRELRNRQALVQRSYKQAIEAEKKKITKEVYPRQPKAEIDRIAKNIKKLEALQRNDLKRLVRSPDSYTTLSLWNAVDPNYLPEEENELEDFNETKEVEKQKIKFNPKNPEHVSRARQVLEEVDGDRDRANKILAEEFDR